MLKTKQRWVQLFWIVIACIIAYGMRTVFSVAAPYVREEYGITATELGLIMSGFSVGYMVGPLAGGILARKFSTKKILVISMLAWVACTALTNVKLSFIALFAIRAMLGVMQGPFFPGANNIIGNWIPTKERSVATGVMQCGVPLGIIFSTLFAQRFVTETDWRSAFLLLSVVAAGVTLLVALFVYEKPEDCKRITPEELKLISDDKARVAATKVTGTNETMPLGQLLSQKVVWVLIVAYLATSCVFWACINWLPTYFMEARGADFLKAGYNFMIPYIGYFFGHFTLSYIVDKTGMQKSTMLTISTFCMVPFIILAVVTPSNALCMLFFCLATHFLAGFYVMIMSLETTLWSGSDVGTVHGFFLISSGLGGIIGPTLLGAVNDMTGSFNSAFYILAALVTIGGFCCMYSIKLEKQLRERAKAQ